MEKVELDLKAKVLAKPKVNKEASEDVKAPEADCLTKKSPPPITKSNVATVR
jgi:hypothetical protein